MTEAPKRLWVPGQPSSQPQPRKAPGGHFYRDDSGWQAEIYRAWYEKFGAEPLKGMVLVDLRFVLTGDTGVEITVSPVVVPFDKRYHQGRNDVDKLTAAVLDALGGHVLGGKRLPPLAYHDDRQVVSLQAQKIKGTKP